MASETDPARQHARTGPASPQPAEPTHAERVRTLLAGLTTGTLSTLSRKHPGFPFGSLMPFALDAAGRPLFLISNMAMHTQNLRADPHASLFVAQASAAEDALGSARATLVGLAEPVPAADLAVARDQYLATHESSRYWVDFADFSFFRLEPVDLYFVGGFGVMGWTSAEDFRSAAPDPLAPAAAGILAHMNADHVDSMLLLAQTQAQAHLQTDVALVATSAAMTSAAMTSIDRLGFTLRLITAEGAKSTRINYPAECRSPTEVRQALVAMVQQARTSA